VTPFNGIRQRGVNQRTTIGGRSTY
jgi:hypothetical protein